MGARKTALAKREPEIIEAPPPKPWEQQPGESARMFAAFCAYRDLPAHGRSVEAAAKIHGRTYSAWGPVATKNRWVARAALWDAEQDRQRREAAIIAVQDQAKKRVQGFDMGYNYGHMMLARNMALAEQNPEAVPMGAVTAVDLMDKAAKASRLERGEPGETVHNVVTPNASPIPPMGALDLSLLSPDELKALRILLAKAMPRSTPA